MQFSVTIIVFNTATSFVSKFATTSPLRSWDELCDFFAFKKLRWTLRVSFYGRQRINNEEFWFFCSFSEQSLRRTVFWTAVNQLQDENGENFTNSKKHIWQPKWWNIVQVHWPHSCDWKSVILQDTASARIVYHIISSKLNFINRSQNVSSFLSSY